MTLSPRLRALLLIALFVVSFVLRSYQPVSRPAQWYRRSQAYDSAIASGNWASTYQSRHPGFIGMVIGGATLHVYDLVKDTPAKVIFSWAAAATATGYGRGMAAGIMGLALVISGLIILNTILLSRLTNWLTALAAGGLMVFSPFYLTHSRVFHLDALVSSLMLTSAVLILLYIERGERRYLLLSGLVAGLAILTKVPSLFLLPYMGLALLVRLLLNLRGGWADHQEGRGQWMLGELWKTLVLPGLAWIGMSLLPWLVWPAMWVKPVIVLQDMFAGTLQHVEEGHVVTRFFAGSIYDGESPPPMFYPTTLIYNTTFISLTLGVLAMVHYLLWPKRAEQSARPQIFWLLVAYVVFFVTQMAIGAKEVDRYILPAHVMLDVIAAVGLAGFVDLLRRAIKATNRVALALPSAVIVAAVGLQALSSLPYAPNYGAHHNYLLGANLGAVNMIEIMGQNEGANYIGEYLSKQPTTADTRVGTAWPLDESVGQYYSGDIEKTTLGTKDFYIFNIAAIQRQYDVGDWRDRWVDDFQYRTPQLVVRLGGIDYIWLYAHDPDPTQETIVIERGLLWLIAGSRIWAILLAFTAAWAIRADQCVLSLVPPARRVVARLRFGEWAAAVGILLGGFVLRVVGFAAAPPGIIHDEVLNWLNAKLVLTGHIQALYPYGGGREALYMLVEAISYRILGVNLIAARLPSLALGMMGIALTFALARRLFGQSAGMLAAAAMGVSFWALMFSRLAVRPGMMPVMGLLTAYLLLRLLQARDPGWAQAALVGVSFGLTLYTYPAALIFPIVIVVWLAGIALMRSRWLRGKWLKVGAALAVAAILAIPLMLAWSNPEATTRAGQISGPLEALFAGNPSPTLENLVPVLGVFTVKGDHGLEFNEQDQPLIPTPILAGLFYLGVLFAVIGVFKGRDGRWPGYLLLLVWLLVMLVPTLVTDRPVNPYRTIGLLGVLYLFMGLAIAVLLQATQKFTRGPWAGTIVLIAVVGLVLELQSTSFHYFDSWAQNPVVKFLYQDEYRQLAVRLDADPNQTPAAIGGLTPFELDPASMQLLMKNDAYALDSAYFDPQTSLLIPATGDQTPMLVAVPASVHLHEVLVRQLAQWGFEADSSKSAYTVYSGDREEVAFTPLATGDTPFFPTGGSSSAPMITLTGMQTIGDPSPGQAFTLLTIWETHTASTKPLRIFVHLTDASRTILAQSDVLGVPAEQWRAGELIIQAHDLALAPDAPPGPYTVSLGVYDPDTGVRLMVGETDHLDTALPAP